MKSKNNIALRLADLGRGLCLVSIIAGFLLVSLVAQQALAQQASSPFEAEFSGDFWIVGDVGKSVLFIVEESGEGNELTFGDFTYNAYMLQNLARIPSGCGPSSSTGVGGFAVLTFDDGQMWLKRISGTACFSFPFISLDDQWRITGGTEAYVGASGKLSRQLEGDVRDNTTSGTINGTIKLP